MTLRELLPDEDFRFSMKFQRGAIAEFFAPTGRHFEMTSQRRRWLAEHPERHAAILLEGVPLLEDFAAMARAWPGQEAWPRKNEETPAEACLALGGTLEPDFLLLKQGGGEMPRLLGACVCFPSSWSLAEKIGKPIDFIHEAVPGLNAQLGKPIHHFLDRLQPDLAWLRSNWGLSRSPELNQHPDRGLPRLDLTVRVEEVWLRVEHQALTALPGSGGILFGIRIAVHSLAELKRDEDAACGLRRAH